jgi:hypothetical protein
MGSPIPSPPPDASATQRGLISTLAQSFAGLKTFLAGAALQAKLSITGVASDANAIELQAGRRLSLGALYLKEHADGRLYLPAGLHFSDDTTQDTAGGSGYSGVWTARSYGTGAIVRRGPFTFGATQATTIDPCSWTEVGDNTKWNALGSAVQSGKIVTLVDGTGQSGASIEIGAVRPTWNHIRLVCDAMVGPAGSGADWFEFGIYDSSLTLTPTLTNGLDGVAGFFGVRITIYPSTAVAAMSNGAASGNTGIPTPLNSNVFNRYILDMSDIGGGNWRLTLYREDATSSLSTSPVAFLNEWTLVKPAFTSWRGAAGGRSGGIGGAFKVRQLFAVDRSGAWDLLAQISSPPHLDSTVW